MSNSINLQIYQGKNKMSYFLLQNTTKVQYLDLSHNHFGDVSGTILGPAIADNTCLKELDLSWNCIRRKGAVAITQGVKVSFKLSSFLVYDIVFGAKTLLQVLAMMLQPSLFMLDYRTKLKFNLYELLKIKNHLFNLKPVKFLKQTCPSFKLDSTIYHLFLTE